MYRLRYPEAKRDPVRRWNLPDRVFFACGACHILAHAFLQRYPSSGFSPLWLRPRGGRSGNHIFLVAGSRAFDYHGYVPRTRLLTHFTVKSRRRWSDWAFDLIPLPPEVLVSESLSKQYDGLWLREPEQFLHNALPRADRFLDRFKDSGTGTSGLRAF